VAGGSLPITRHLAAYGRIAESGIEPTGRRSGCRMVQHLSGDGASCHRLAQPALPNGPEVSMRTPLVGPSQRGPSFVCLLDPASGNGQHGPIPAASS